MAGFVTGLDNNAVVITSVRSIIGDDGTTIIPDCVVEEIGRDELQITEHPIEKGASITDHAFKKPREVTLRWEWSNSGHGSETYVQQVLDVLLTLQATLSPFTLYTGKSSYINMLIHSLSHTTSNNSEYSLSVVIVCKEIIIVSTSEVSFAPQSAQALPKKTSPVKSIGSCNVTSLPTGSGSNITSSTSFPIQDGVS